MPAQILHTLFGEDLLTELSHPERGLAEPVLERLCSLYREYPRVFALGCQGPDIYYHSQMTRPMAVEYGTLLHRRGYGDFTAALFKHLLDRKGGETRPLLAYALGFMTHAALDRAAHPYIVYQSNLPVSPQAIFPQGAAHAFFERLLDVLMLALLRGKPIASWDQGALAAVCGEPPPGLRELLAHTLVQVFPQRAAGDRQLFQRISNAFKDCAYFYGLTDPRKPSLQYPLPLGEGLPQKQLVFYQYPERFPLSIDYLNLGHATWYYPTQTGPADTRSFPELYHAAVQTFAAALRAGISRYRVTGTFSVQEAAQHIGNRGLSIQDETGKPCAPTRVNPLPLERVLTFSRSFSLTAHINKRVRE